MPARRVTLETASYLDSPQARSLAVPGGDQREIVQSLLTVCFDQLGVEPAKLDGELLHEALAEHLPLHFGSKDPRIESVALVVRTYLEHLAATAVVTHSFEIAAALDAALAAFESNVLRQDKDLPHADQTVVHRAAKIGRNDPCFCGSGRKFKKCCGAK